MAKLKASLLSFSASGRLGKLFSLARRQGRNIIEKRPVPTDAKSSAQLFSRHMFTKCVDLWHLLSEAEHQAWEAAARPKHMTGYAWYISQCLRPNPGIYLPLQGGDMAGDIDMEGFSIGDLPDPTNPQDADTLAAREAAIAAALEDCIDSHLHAWDGANWQKLLTESAVNPNLRVRLFGAGSAVTIDEWTYANVVLASYASLAMKAQIMLVRTDTTGAHLDSSYHAGDNVDGTTLAAVGLHGFDGSTYDRLRSYPTGILKVGRAELPTTEVRKVAAGLVVAGSHKLYWLACSPESPAAEWELTDAVAGSAAIKYDHFDSDKHSEQITFDPPMKFATGIWIEKFDHMKSLTFSYI